MGYPQQGDKRTGATLLAAAIALVVVAVLVGIGVYITQRQPTTTTSTPSAITLDGTSASVNQLTQADAQEEQKVDQSADAQVERDVLSANGATSNVGGAYNETTF